MPPLADGKLPLLLSETGAFNDTAKLIPNAGLIPYELIVPFWSDGAEKSRWVAVPRGKIAFAPTGEWSFPAGTVFVKTFDLPTDESDPRVRRRLETRVLVRDSAGGVYGVVYKWRRMAAMRIYSATARPKIFPSGVSMAKSVSKLGTTPAARTV